LRIKKLKIKNFRCFSSLDLNFDDPVVIIQGDNGTGKTSILEALHYLCYMRSFRTHTPRNLIKFGKDGFFVKVSFSEGESQVPAINYDLQVGFDKNRKIVKLNKKNITAFKELIDFYRIVTLTEDDLGIIKSGPDVRRAFVDNAIFVFDNSFATSMREFKKVLENRNSLLQADRMDSDSYDLWTKQLWEKSRRIQQKRNEVLQELQERVNACLADIFKEDIAVELSYRARNIDLQGNYGTFALKLPDLRLQEVRFRRSLFGAHLDDFIVKFQSKKSKNFASRGQQKLIILLLKAAQIMCLTEKKGPAIFLLDDFMTDFDEERAKKLANFLLSLNSQIIFTSPCRSGFFENLSSKVGVGKILLTD